jgi:hypothetical protein
MVVGDALVDFERRIADLHTAIDAGISDPSGFKTDDVKPPPFPLDDRRNCVAALPSILAQRVYGLKRSIRDYEDALATEWGQSFVEGRPPDAAAIRPWFAMLFVTVDDVRREVVASLGWPEDVIESDLENQMRTWATRAKRNRNP